MNSSFQNTRGLVPEYPRLVSVSETVLKERQGNILNLVDQAIMLRGPQRTHMMESIEGELMVHSELERSIFEPLNVRSPVGRMIRNQIQALDELILEATHLKRNQYLWTKNVKRFRRKLAKYFEGEDRGLLPYVSAWDKSRSRIA